MKRFWVYAGATYHPAEAGIDDFVGAFDTAAEAEVAAKAACIGNKYLIWAWWHVVEVTDSSGPKTVADGDIDDIEV